MSWVEAARAARAGAGWLLRHWWIAALVGLAIALHMTRGTLADARHETIAEKAARKAEHDAAATLLAQTEARWSANNLRAFEGYAARLADRQPIILRSTDTGRTYAQTPAGRAFCHGADRVRGVDAFDAALFPETTFPATGGAGPVPADPNGATAGRLSVER